MSRSLQGFVALIACAAAAPLVAGDAWQSKGPYGGHIYEILTRADRPDLVFAVAVGGLFRSLDRGEHWSRADSGVNGLVGEVTPGTFSGNVVLDPLDPAGVWLYDDAGALYHSTDSGDSWQATGFVAGAKVLTLAVDAASPQHVYLGTSNALLQSDDLGQTFVPLGDGHSPHAANSILVDPADATHVIAAGAWDTTPLSSPFFYSFDTGASWASAFSPCDPQLFVCSGMRDMSPIAGGGAVVASTGSAFRTDDGRAWDFVVPATSATTLSTNGVEAVLVGGSYGLGFTADLFETTTLVNNGLSLDGTTPLEVQSSRLFPAWPAAGPWFAGTYIDGVYRSDDDGASWHATNDGLAAVRIASLAIDPNDSSHGFAGASATGSFMGGRAMWATSQHGDSWVPVAAPPDAYTIRDIEYDPTTSGAATTIYATGIYAGQRGDATPTSGLYKSTNGGVDWSVLDGGLPPPYGSAGAMRNLAIDPRSCASPPATGVCTSGPLQVIYATSTGTYDSDINGTAWRVLKTNDAGATWTSSDSGLPQEVVFDFDELIYTQPIVVDPANGDIVYVGTLLYTDGPYASAPGIESGVFRSDDGGASWAVRSVGLPHYPGATDTALDVLDLAIHPTQTGTLWAAVWNQFDPTNSGAVYKTTDGGANWFASSKGLALGVVTTLRVDPTHPDTIYAGGGTPGNRTSIYRSDDGGAHWRPVEGSPASHVSTIAIDPDDPTRILAGTQTGVWVSGGAIFADGFDPSAVP